MDGTDKQRAMIKAAQCAGCVCGSAPETCEAYSFKQIPWDGSGGFHCEAHVVGTSLAGGIRFALGLPKGFNRPGETTNRMTIRLWEAGQQPTWDRFNVPVWGLEQDGLTYVRTYCPRNNLTRVDVCEGLPLEKVAPVYDVGTFLDEID